MTNLIERLRDDEANSFGGLYCAKRELVHEAATALSEAKAENERVTRERDKWFREAEERADACSLLIRERDGLKEALKPFALEADDLRDNTQDGQTIKLHATAGQIRMARAALNPKGGDMGKPEDIPQDVFEAAFSVVSEIQMQDAGSVESWDARASVARVARAILAERERCAAIADEHERAKWGGPDRDPTVAMRKAALSIAAAIRKGSD